MKNRMAKLRRTIKKLVKMKEKGLQDTQEYRDLEAIAAECRFTLNNAHQRLMELQGFKPGDYEPLFNKIKNNGKRKSY